MSLTITAVTSMMKAIIFLELPLKGNRNKFLMITAIIIGIRFLDFPLWRPQRERIQVPLKTAMIIGKIFLELTLWRPLRGGTDFL